jgi:glutaredoxin domain-containing cysteine-rich protein 1
MEKPNSFASLNDCRYWISLIASLVLWIHEEGKMVELLARIPTGMAGIIYDGCGGVRFIPCMECSGSCKLVNDDNMVVVTGILNVI